jgi:hypothetical protein
VTPEGPANRLFGKRSAFLLGPQPLGHLEFLPKLAQVLVSSAINYVNVINYKQNQEYQQEYGLSSQDAQDEQYSKYSNPNIKDNSLFTVPLDFEGFPFVELRLINAGKIGDRKVLNFDIHICRPSLNHTITGFMAESILSDIRGHKFWPPESEIDGKPALEICSL